MLLWWFQSSDGDIIDCVPSHHQPAFDHPLLKGHKPMVIAKNPRSYSNCFFFLKASKLYEKHV